MFKFMKKILLVSAALLLSQTALAGKFHVYDRPVPWPWGHEQPFPWSSIQGVWKISDDAGMTVSYFTFRVVSAKKTGLKQLMVHQVDAYTCETIAQGVGIELNNVLRAQMTTTEYASVPGVTFRVSIRAFKEESSPEPVIGTYTSRVMVLSITDLDRDPSKNLHVQIGKTSAKLAVKGCGEEPIGLH